MSVILCFYEGVLQTHKDQPILDGFRLVQALGISHRVIVATSGSAARVDHQLRTERLQAIIAEIVDEKADLPPLPLWSRQIESIRSRYPVSMVISADPMVIQWVVERGVVGLFFAHPGFGRPMQRPEQGNRTWERLLEELEARP
jgi:hypothetical protein